MSNKTFYIKPKNGELVSSALTLSQCQNCSIHGVVQDELERPIAGALVLLFHSQGLAPIAQSTTDHEGHFAFYPLEAQTLYKVKVFTQNQDIRPVVQV